MKSVLVVGAGPAGLVTAKTLLQHGGGANFKVTVFEAAQRLGGMWRAPPGEQGDKCSPFMRTNLSRFTVSFADLSWASVDLSDPANPVHGARTPAPMFPYAWQVGRYLETYAQKFLPESMIRLNRKVTAADYLQDGQPGAWHIKSTDMLSKQEFRDEFDYLIVASGFFDQPASLQWHARLPEEASAVNVRHSSQFDHVASIAKESGKIVVIGGGMSGSEAAAVAAFQISSAKHSPRKEKLPYEDEKVYHIFNRPFYCLPRYLPQKPYNPAIQDFSLSPNFLPLDLLLYNLSRRGDAPISASHGTVPAEKAKKGHEYIRSLLGSDQRDIGRSELVYKANTLQYPAYVGITDTYAEFVRSGLIVPILGRATINPDQHDPGSPNGRLFSVEVVPQIPWADTQHDSRQFVSGVAGIVEATGYQVRLDYLSNRVKRLLDYDTDCHRLPLLLSRGSIFNPSIPHMAFVGFYEGPYWGVMEMQARLIAQAWNLDQDPDHHATLGFSDMSGSSSVRQAIKCGALDIPQFWMPDYVGMMEEFARHTHLKRDDCEFPEQIGPVFPARYRDSTPDSDAPSISQEVAKTLQQSQKHAKFVAAATFRGMQGTWILKRKIDSRHPSMPSGTFKGTADFHPRVPTDPTFTAEYLYIEQGTLTMDNGLTFPANRRYVYRYNELMDTITAWFTDEDGLSVANLFNTWEFYPPDDTEHGWFAKGSHWCDPDTYKNTCEFRFRGAGLETFGITYEVSGPKKDYWHESWYSRPKPLSR